MPKADEAIEEAPEVLPLLLLDPEVPDCEGLAPEAEPEPEPELAARPVEAELLADLVELEATLDEVGTSDLIPFEMVLVVLQLEVEGVE